MIEERQSLVGEIALRQTLYGELNKFVEVIAPTTQIKTVIPSEERQIIEPNEGIFALSKVIVEAIPPISVEQLYSYSEEVWK